MLQLTGSDVVEPPFRQAPLPVGALTLVVVETALVTPPALAVVAESSTVSPERARSATSSPEIRVLVRAFVERGMTYPKHVPGPDRLRRRTMRIAIPVVPSP